MLDWKKIGATTLCLTMLGVSPGFVAWKPSVTPVSDYRLTASAEARLSISGEMVWEDLEGGFYAINGYRLIGDHELFEQYLGQLVKVSGTLSNEASIYMVRGIEVDQIELAERQTLTGKLTWEDLETGFYAVAGYRLIGDAEQFEQYLDKQVMVVGTLSPEPSIFMTKAIKVEAIRLLSAEVDPVDRYLPLDIARPLPAKAAVDGNQVNFSQDPVVIDHVLYIPLKALVKAADGRVHWFGKTRTATVELPDRTAIFVVGEQQAEMSEDGVAYLQRNLITLAKPVMLLRGHTYISADALTTVLGMKEEGTGAGNLQLVSAHAIKERQRNQLPEEQMGDTIRGSIREVQTGARTSFLLAGPEMSNGEPFLIWVTVTDDTNIHWSNRGNKASHSDLEVGQRLTVVLSGPIMESYPAQGGAQTVIITAEEDVVEPMEDLVTGTIEDISSGDRTRILVSGPPMQSGEPYKIWVSFCDDAEIHWWNNVNRPAEISDLKVGQSVEVKLWGPVLMSYPAQGSSHCVTILKK